MEKKLRIHYLQHVPFEGLGCIEGWAKANAHRISATRFYANEPLPNINEFDWLIVMGGPMNINEEVKFPWLTEEKRFLGQVIENKKIVLGICLGAQLTADVLGAKIYANRHKEIGWYTIRKTKPSDASGIADVFPDSIEAFHWHGDTFDIPAGADHIVQSAGCKNQGFTFGDRVLALQFHLEIAKSGAENLIIQCGNEINKGRFCQTPEAMLADPDRFEKINKLMYRILDHLAAESAG
jgi:GMP synthase (glutamine-hydrolysing)